MYLKITSGYVLPSNSRKGPISSSRLDLYFSETLQSHRWKNWRAILDDRLCVNCFHNHGKIYAMSEDPLIAPPLHAFCRCGIIPMEARILGDATNDGKNGADYWLANYGILPNYYITDSDLRSLGWKKGKSPEHYAPGKMYTRGTYHNFNGHLPSAPGRIWYEADINYYSGHRGSQRILYSNDGLLFATYDHYLTFVEITTGGETAWKNGSL